MKHFEIQFKKDFVAFFNGLTPYTIIGSYYLLSFFSALYLGNYFSRESNVMLSYFIMQPFILILIIPAITMRSWSDEIKSGTIELLLTQPISYFHLVLAKYSAAFSVFLVLVLLSIPFLIITSFFSVMDWGIVLSSYLGLFLCGALFTALGCLISIICRNNIMSFICTIFVLFFISQLNFSDLHMGRILLPLSVFNFNSNYNAFLSGSILLSNFIYFAISIILLLWLNTVVLLYRQSSNRSELYFFKRFCILLFLIFSISILSSFFIFQRSIDVTDYKLYTITKQNKSYLNKLDKRIDIVLYEAKQKREEENSSYAAYSEFIEKFLEQIQKESFNAVRYSIVRVEPFSAMERRLINENIPYEEDALGHKSYMALDVSDNNGNSYRINTLSNQRQNLLEADIMRLIRLLGQTKKNIAVVADDQVLKSTQGFCNFLNEFYNVTYLNFSLQYLPTTYDAVIVINPDDITEEFLFALDQYILNGGNIALFDEPSLIRKTGDTYLIDFFYTYGIKPIPEDLVLMNDSPLALAKPDTTLWPNLRVILTHEAGKTDFRTSQYFNISPALFINDTPIAVISEGKYVTHFPDMAQQYSDVLSQSEKKGVFAFIYDSDLIKDYLYISSDSKGMQFYQMLSLADNAIFYMQLLDKLTQSNTEKGLSYKYYSTNLISIGDVIFNLHKQKQNKIILKLQNEINLIKQELSTLDHTSIHNLGRMSRLTQDLEQAENNLNIEQQLLLKNYQSSISSLTIAIIFIIPTIILCLMAVCIYFYRKNKYIHIGRLLQNETTH